MKVKKVKGFLVFLILLILVIQSSSAAMIKDGTTYFNEEWQGKTYTGEINWAVYDDPTGFSYELPGDGAYVYIYEVTNYDTSDGQIAHFGILGLDENNVSGIGSTDDGYSGAQNHDEYLDDTDGAVWKWSDDETFRYVELDDHSWWLILTSDYGPVVRDYEIRGINESVPLEGPDVPEPTMMAIFGLGSYFVIRRNRNRVKN